MTNKNPYFLTLDQIEYTEQLLSAMRAGIEPEYIDTHQVLVLTQMTKLALEAKHLISCVKLIAERNELPSLAQDCERWLAKFEGGGE